MKTALITGISGQDGAFLAKNLLSKGYRVVGADRRSADSFRWRLDWLGIQNKINISLIIQQSKIPVIIDAGIGIASDATIAMELGCDGVLANTAIAKAKKPFLMSLAFKNAVIAGRQSFLAGRIEKSIYGSTSSPTTGII